MKLSAQMQLLAYGVAALKQSAFSFCPTDSFLRRDRCRGTFTMNLRRSLDNQGNRPKDVRTC
jgi:hypothetical protein